ncbi:antichymotrypsin-2-like isoform X2 [Anticarsia gemmatalis]|uniref:antichymotrypsin-2-like isoform X2 n=1 Tax=Anticarsia gemmatalis TaxID=129554 RepID=UPI003F759543
MRICLVFLFLSLVRSWRSDYDTDERTSEEDLEYIPHVSTTMDFRGVIRKRFAVELGLAAMGRNRICSPLSALLPLGKLLLGASKETKEELLDAVGLRKRRELKAVISQIIKELEYLNGVEISIASRVYVSNRKKLRSKFKRRTKKVFGSSFGTVDFSKSRTVAKEINSWVSEKTKNKINDIVTPDDINDGASLIIVNAIYFKGRWQYPFPGTYQDTFYGPSGSSKAYMMRRTGQYNYYESNEMNAQIIEIPYTGEEAALIIVLPSKKDGLSILLRTLKISPDLINDALMKMKTATVDLIIPKFKIESTLDLKDYYYRMGIKRVISNYHSQLTDIVRGENVYISKAIQKAYIEVTEKGTVAAAATVLSVMGAFPTVNAIRMRADHPFLFFVRANKEQMFGGVVEKPKWHSGHH